MKKYQISNYVLKQNIDDIEIININLKIKFSELSIPIIEHETFINWENINPHFSFMFDYLDNKEISTLLINSLIINYKKINLYFGEDEPIVEMDTILFINKWEDFVAANGYTGLILFTSDGQYFAEFTDDKEYKLYSNFPIEN